MEDDGEDYRLREAAAPSLVTLSPFAAPCHRRLSSQFQNPESHRPVPPVRPFAWVSLQGRIVGAEEASSARAVGVAGLGAGEAVAWELFTPIQRVLIVAVAAAAAANSEKNRQIHRLQKCVQLRDEILSSMQQKLDCLCEQVHVGKDQAPLTALAGSHCWLCDQHRAQLCDVKQPNTNSETQEMFKCKMPALGDSEPEERRMSGLSDWASSVTSSDIQLDSLAMELDIYNLKRDCEEKDVTIKELSEFIRSKDTENSQRVEELEDIIQQKTMIISKLRKDMAVLEQRVELQKLGTSQGLSSASLEPGVSSGTTSLSLRTGVVQLTRQKRRSFSGGTPQPIEIPEARHNLAVRDNVLYDMDNTTSPSSSDSDTSSTRSKNNPSIHTTSLITKPAPNRTQNSAPTKNNNSLQEKPKILSASAKKKQFSVNGEQKKSRRRSLNGLRDVAPSQKRWV